MSGVGPQPAEAGSLDSRNGTPGVLYGWNADDMSAFPEGPHDSGCVAERTRRVFETPLTALRTELEHAGARAYGYRLDWRPLGSPLGATHCVEIPLLLGSANAWRNAPMLGDARWAEVDAIGRQVRGTWATFAHGRNPGPMPAPLTALAH
ncbi:hypothetical protein [Streptomyces parvulus]|uniref:Carboxylesterase type B domain-containing protein n=1 Tax=Streptomyces parvulus TaxID=146923 RepID=A0ABV5D8T7_9ACTN